MDNEEVTEKTLFRPDALRALSTSHLGAIRIVSSARLWVVAGAATLLLLLGLTSLLQASYRRIGHSPGELKPSNTTSDVAISGDATVCQLYIVEGSEVKRGELLALTSAGTCDGADEGQSTLIAPQGGRIEGLRMAVGQRLSASSKIFSLLVKDSNPTAVFGVREAYLPYLKEGDRVTMSLAAYPPSRFGTLSGRISSVGSAPVKMPARGEARGDTRLYLVEVEVNAGQKLLGDSSFRRRSLAVTAHFSLEQHKLYQWLFEPLRTSSESRAAFQ